MNSHAHINSKPAEVEFILTGDFHRMSKRYCPFLYNNTQYENWQYFCLVWIRGPNLYPGCFSRVGSRSGFGLSWHKKFSASDVNTSFFYLLYAFFLLFAVWLSLRVAESVEWGEVIHGWMIHCSPIKPLVAIHSQSPVNLEIPNVHWITNSFYS